MSRSGFPIDMKQDSTVTNSYDTWNGQHFSGTDAFHFKRYQFEDKVGGNTPGWPHAKRSNDYLRSKFTWNQNHLSVDGTVDNGFGHIDHFSGDWADTFGLGFVPWMMQNNPLALGDQVAIVRSKLVGKLIDSMQSNRTNLGEIAHTRGQTANMVASTANRLAQAFRSVRRGNFAGAARYLTGSGPRGRYHQRALGGIPEQWLALQYGWKPLLQDVYNSCETVRKAWNDNGDVFTAKAHAKENGGNITIDLGRAQPHGPSLEVVADNREVRGNASVTYKVESALGSSLSQLGITNPASLAWELLPYSFVVDWFVPVGSFLERADYSRGLIFSHGWISIQARQNARLLVKEASAHSGNISANWSGGNGSGEAFVFTREALVGFPDPPPPRFKNPLSLTHVANALSLLATAFGR